MAGYVARGPGRVVVVPRRYGRGMTSQTVCFGDPAIGLPELVPAELRALATPDHQRALPAIARDPRLSKMAEEAARSVSTEHVVVLGDGRKMDDVADESTHLVVTSPPYWNLKPYERGEGQLGLIDDYESFLAELDKVWAECLRVLVPGGRLVVVVGDVLLPRRVFGRHVVFPLHSSIQEHCRLLGFDNLAPIIWAKIGNARHEVENGSRFLGKPYEPNAIVKNDIEYILFQRKPGGYRRPSLSARLLSVIPEARHREWFQQIWSVPGASTRSHPAPFPVGMIERLVRMFSFVGDVVVDPFLGSGTTSVAASRWGRNSIGYEIEPRYVDLAVRRLRGEARQAQLVLETPTVKTVRRKLAPRGVG
jgi:DNA modification methylase